MRREQMMNKMKNKLKGMVCMAVFGALIATSGSTVTATENAVTQAAIVDNTVSEAYAATKKEGKIITKKGQKYYKYPNGKIAKSRFITIKKKTYYFTKTGVMQTGWMKRSGEYYYFDRNTGVQKKNCTIDGIKIKKDGTASATTQAKKKMDLMITARKKMLEVTKPTDSQSEKLKKVFNWVLKHPYKRYRRLAEAKNSAGWEIDYANEIFKKGNGCCVSEACAFAFLAKECGYKKVYVRDDTGHAWVEIKGRVFDTLFAETKGFNLYYNSTYTQAKLHRVGKKKI